MRCPVHRALGSAVPLATPGAGLGMVSVPPLSLRVVFSLLVSHLIPEGSVGSLGVVLRQATVRAGVCFRGKTGLGACWRIGEPTPLCRPTSGSQVVGHGP